MSKYSNIDIERMRDEVLDYGDDVFYAYNKVVPYHTNKKEAEFADIFIDTVKSQIKNALDVGKSIENARKILHKEIRRSAINELNRVLGPRDDTASVHIELKRKEEKTVTQVA